MRVLIIGSKGFIGHYLHNHMLQKGYEVWGADVIMEYFKPEKYFQIDSTNSDFKAVFEQEKYDICINCSGAASVPESLTNPIRDYFLNTVNVYKILAAIKMYQSECKFINISSAAVYGSPKIIPIKEEFRQDPLSPYGYHKLQAEQICREFWDLFRIRTCSVRIFSVYGPGLKKQLFWDLYKKINSGSPVILYGTGEESRDFIYILDLVEAISLVAEHSGFEADVINIANGEEIFIKDAVATFFALLDNKISYSFSGELRKGDPLNWQADIGKLKTFGYIPLISMQEGLQNYCDWIKSLDIGNN